MRILHAAAIVIAISASVGMIAVLGCRSSGDVEPDLVLAENQGLRAENASLVQENVRLSTENENLQEQLNDLLIEGASQETLALENVRLTGELQRAQRDLAGETARREELQEGLEEERRARLRLEQLLDNANNRRNDTSNFGWLGLLAALALASAAIWRERWWRSKILTTAQTVRVVRGDRDAMIRRATNVTSLEADKQDR